MAVRIFLLGRPGSGKTTAASYLSMLARDEKSLSEKFLSLEVNDYTFLRKMCIADTDHRRFRPTDHNGFDVLDFSVLDEALQDLEKEVTSLSDMYQFITIEFARDDYGKALKIFSNTFLKDSYFLYFDTNLETCLERIHARVAQPISEGDHPSLSDEGFRKYYGKENNYYIQNYFVREFSLQEQQLIIVKNEGTKEMFVQELRTHYHDVFQPALKQLLLVLS